jgi:glycosyltransferase involved in cell wall biosynthesis
MVEKSKIALVIQRFGDDITGGAEWHCAQIAHYLKPYYDIDVLTTCAKDYTNWQPVLPAGTETVDGITVKRFFNYPRASKAKLRKIRKLITHRLTYQWLLRLLGIYEQLTNLHPTKKDEKEWLIAQGPYCPDMIEYLATNHHQYQSLFFFSVLYYPTAVGALLFPKKSILIPMLHDEKANYYSVYKQIFDTDLLFFFNTLTEAQIATKIYGDKPRRYEIVGVGIDDDHISFNDKPISVKQEPYIFYAGRIDKNKGCKQLIQFFLAYKEKYPSSLQLVLVGHLHMHIPKHASIQYLGYVSSEEKNALIRNAVAVVVPSYFESLSLLMLEAMWYNRPVLVNKQCAVLVEHADRSKAAFAYDDSENFSNQLHSLVNNSALNQEMGALGHAYVKKNYAWEKIIDQYRKAISAHSSTISNQ